MPVQFLVGFGRISYDGDYVTGVEEKPDIAIEALAGIYIMKPAIFDLIPENEYFGMDSLIKNMLANGKPVAKYNLKEYWLDIGQLPDYELAQDVYEQHFKDES